MTAGACRSCGARDLQRFYEVSGVPVNSCMLVGDREAAVAFPTGDLRLSFCPACGFIQNDAFDPAMTTYSVGYEETQAFSPHFRAFAEQLAADLVERHDLRDRDILEIGCGKAEFLLTLCALGGNRGIGIDPGVDPRRIPPDAGVSVIADFYSPAYTHLDADFVCCRHTLEHIAPVADFVDLVATSTACRRGAPVFFEVPDVRRVLREGAFWDLYYEHCSYFTLRSLARLFQDHGYAVTRLQTAFAAQYLLLDAVLDSGPQPPIEDDLADVARDVDHFATIVRQAQAEWAGRVERFAHDGKRVVLWGSGSKAVAFLTTLDIRDHITDVVDINPYKQGKYLAGTGQRIIAPAQLTLDPPDAVVVVNPVYRSEIERDLTRLGIEAQVLTL